MSESFEGSGMSTQSEQSQEEDLFGFIEESQIFKPSDIVRITADEMSDVEYQNYALSLYQRLARRVKAPAEAYVAEAIEQETGTGEPLLEPEWTRPTSRFPPEEAKDVMMVTVGDSRYEVSVPKAAFISKWLNLAEADKRELKQQVADVAKLQGLQVREYTRRILLPLENVSIPSRDKERAKFVRSVLENLIIEKNLEEQHQHIAKQCEHIYCEADDVENGVFITTLDDQLPQFVQNIGTRYLTTTSKHSLNAMQVGNLVSSLFQSDSEIRAKAKLDLTSTLKKDTMSLYHTNPSRLLIEAFSEARLTTDEILGVIFSKDKGQQSKCPHCNINVTVSASMYHTKCVVIRWLTETCHFRYEEEEQVLITKETRYLNSEVRYKLATVLKRAAALKRSVLIRNAKEVSLWSADGVHAKKSVLQTIKPEEVVGSYAWRQKHGLITPPRK